MRGNLYRRLFMEEEELLSEKFDPESDDTGEVESTETEEVDDANDTKEVEDDGRMTVDDMSDDMFEEPVDDNFGGQNPYPVDSNQTVNSPASVGIDVTMTNFGADNSPQQNQYDPKEIERLNALIASENSAIGEYFQASKETNVDVLRRLYSDIGEEERFHSEQLLFAKSQITGERYVPRDPDVKHEYEELLSMGMDEETAMTTAVDKVGLMKQTQEVTPEESVQQLEFVVDQLEMVQKSIYQEYLIFELSTSSKIYSTRKRDEAIGVYVEAYLNDTFSSPEMFLEDVANATEKDKGDVKILSVTIKGFLKLIGNIIGAIKRVAHSIAIWATNMRQHRKAKLRWLKNHSFADLFKSGLHLYFYDDEKAQFTYDDATKYLGRLRLTASMIANKVGVSLQEKSQQTASVADNFKPTTIEEAVDNIRNVSLSKTKVILNNKNTNMFLDQAFGLGQDLGGAKQDSVYNKLDRLLKDFNSACESTKGLLEKMDAMGNDNTSLKYKDVDLYKKMIESINYVLKSYQMFINAITSDMQTLVNADKEFTRVATQEEGGSEGETPEKTESTNGAGGGNANANADADANASGQKPASGGSNNGATGSNGQPSVGGPNPTPAEPAQAADIRQHQSQNKATDAKAANSARANEIKVAHDNFVKTLKPIDQVTTNADATTEMNKIQTRRDKIEKDLNIRMNELNTDHRNNGIASATKITVESNIFDMYDSIFQEAAQSGFNKELEPTNTNYYKNDDLYRTLVDCYNDLTKRYIAYEKIQTSVTSKQLGDKDRDNTMGIADKIIQDVSSSIEKPAQRCIVAIGKGELPDDRDLQILEGNKNILENAIKTYQTGNNYISTYIKEYWHDGAVSRLTEYYDKTFMPTYNRIMRQVEQIRGLNAAKSTPEQLAAKQAAASGGAPTVQPQPAPAPVPQPAAAPAPTPQPQPKPVQQSMPEISTPAATPAPEQPNQTKPNPYQFNINNWAGASNWVNNGSQSSPELVSDKTEPTPKPVSEPTSEPTSEPEPTPTQTPQNKPQGATKYNGFTLPALSKDNAITPNVISIFKKKMDVIRSTRTKIVQTARKYNVTKFLEDNSENFAVKNAKSNYQLAFEQYKRDLEEYDRLVNGNAHSADIQQVLNDTAADVETLQLRLAAIISLIRNPRKMKLWG